MEFRIISKLLILYILKKNLQGTYGHSKAG